MKNVVRKKGINPEVALKKGGTLGFEFGVIFLGGLGVKSGIILVSTSWAAGRCAAGSGLHDFPQR